MKNFLLLVLIILGLHLSAQNKEETAIKNLLEKESATWRAGEIEAHADCWKIRPYSRIIISTGDGTVIDVPPEDMIHPPKGVAGGGGTSENSNYKMHISGNNAWVSHDEVSYSKTGKKTSSSEFRILEKIGGKWKLTGQSILIRKEE
ncbi:MAG: endo-arabinase [Salegentibacter sp.]